MYSLGVVFFEMVHPPFGTRMERIETLKNIRKPEVLLPPRWKGKDKEVAIIRRLLSHDPSERPSARVLLESNFLPPALVEERVADVVKLLRQPRSAQRPVVRRL